MHANGMLTILNLERLKNSTAHFGILSSKKGVKPYEELAQRYPAPSK